MLQVRTFTLTVFSVLLLTSGLMSAVSAYGCMQLQNVVLQQKFLSTNIGTLMEEYMGDQEFRSRWDNLQVSGFI